MQVANALNNNIRILFNPKVEPFKLFDFLMVKSDEDRYLAQIIEIYDDKFDSSQDVAKLRLFYKITPNNEVMPYDNFTPNKECEIVKIKQDEVETFINQGKRTFIFGTNTKSSTSLNIQFDFFNNNPVVLADKVDNSNAISLNLAKNLSAQKHTIIIDSTGVIDFEDAQKIKASKNFRLPLNYSTIDFVFDKCLSDASLEFQQIAGSIILEIKKFAKRQALEFIPFNVFARVLLEQYKATPYPELKLLLVRLKKCQMDEIFAKTKKDIETLFKTIEKNPITIIDISNVSSLWQKAYLEYFISAIEENVYLITRINDENCDVDLINKIYTEKRNIKFIPTVSYNYKKLPSIMQYCKNYILLPSLYQRTDFLNANFALANLISDGCIIFGENTDNFLYLAKDYTLETQEKRKNYRKIALSMANMDSNPQQNQAENNSFTHKNDSQRLIDELTELEESQKKLKEEQDIVFNPKNTPSEEPSSSEEDFEEIEEPKTQQDDFLDITDDKAIDEHDDFSTDDDKKIQNEEPKQDNLQLTEELISLPKEEKTKEELPPEKEENNPSEEKEDTSKENEDTIIDFEEDEGILDTLDTINIKEEPQDEQKDEEQQNEEQSFDEKIAQEAMTREEKDAILKEKFNIKEAELIDPDEASFENPTTVKLVDNKQEQKEENELDFSDEELDFFQIAKESSMQFEQEELKKEKVIVDDIEYKTQDDTQDNKKKDEINNLAIKQTENKTNDIDLNEIANNSIDESFNEIIDKKPQESSQTINIDSEVKIDIDKAAPIEKENLPIFKEEQDKTPSEAYKIGDIVIHKKYGKGTVVKTIKYEERQLLQIEFEQSGKKLLDPKVADIKLEQ